MYMLILPQEIENDAETWAQVSSAELAKWKDMMDQGISKCRTCQEK